MIIIKNNFKRNKNMKKVLLMAAVMLASVGAYAQHAVGSFNL